MKSTLVNMTAVLFGITLVASAGVGAVNMITAEPIAQAEQAAKVEALLKQGDAGAELPVALAALESRLQPLTAALNEVREAAAPAPETAPAMPPDELRARLADLAALIAEDDASAGK